MGVCEHRNAVTAAAVFSDTAWSHKGDSLAAPRARRAGVSGLRDRMDPQPQIQPVAEASGSMK